MLISEAARSEGGRLFIYRDGEKWYFMEEKYSELDNLMPRDIVSREIWYVMGEYELGHVFLDLTGVSEEKLKDNLLDLVDDCETFFDIDVWVDPIPVVPGIHYFMGGLWVDEFHRCDLRGLYAAGECCCQYHGANRLGGNSILGAIFGGVVASETAINDINENSGCLNCFLVDEVLDAINSEISLLKSGPHSFSFSLLKFELSSILENSLGIVRDDDSLRRGVKLLDDFFENKVLGNYDKNSSIYDNLFLKNLCILSKSLLLSAIAREESRGAHYRGDFPKIDDSFRKTTIARYDDEISISFEDLK